MRKLVSLVVLALLLSLITPFVTAQSLWIPYSPSSGAVELVYWKQGGIAYMTVSITVGSLNGYNISNWGTPTVTGKNITVNIEMWRYLGITVPVITVKSYTYNLSRLQLGEYLFVFKAWGTQVKNTTFTVPPITVPDDYPTIQEAINNAQDGDTVFVRNGTYYEHSILVNKTLRIIGEAHSSTTLYGGPLVNHIFKVTAANVLISGFNLEYTRSYAGIWGDSASNLTVEGNAFTNNANGIYLRKCNSTALINNIFQSCTFSGIQSDGSWHVEIRGNSLDLLFFPSYTGMLLVEGGDFLVWENDISHCDIGIAFRNLLNSSFFHNNLINSSVNADDYGGVSTNSISWDNYFEGNFWSDYNGTDADGDGIGDTPYLIDENNQDNYPLMNLYWNPADINHDLKIDISDLARTSGAFGSYPGHPKWNPHCDITGLEYLVPDGKVDIIDVAVVSANFGKYHEQ